MARYTGPVCRLCRRSGVKLMLKGDRCLTPKCAVDRRSKPPGQQSARFRRVSDHGLQLREKQKARQSYGLMEGQFRRFFRRAEHATGVTSDNLTVLLERRMDSTVLRLGFADSLAQARQLVRHGHLMLNGHKHNVPSTLLKEGDTVSWREGSTRTEYYKRLQQTIESKNPTRWLSLDKKTLTGVITSVPVPGDIEPHYEGKSIVEFYSR